MSTTLSARLGAASLVIAVTGALLSVLGGPVAADPSDPSDPSHPAVTAGHHGGHQGGHQGGKKHKGKVRWDSTTYASGFGAVVAHGKVPGGKKKVRLQVKIPGRWDTFAKTKSNRKGKFSITGRLDWYGKHKVRISTQGRKAFKKSHKVVVVPAYTPRGSAADFTYLTDDGSGLRYTWNPCQTVRYVVNADDVGPAGITMVQQAMAQVSAATGIRTKYVGTSHVISHPNAPVKLGKRQDLLVSWGDEAEVPEFTTGPIGFGGPDKAYLARTARGKKVWMTTQASIVLDTTAYNSGNFTQGFIGPKPTWGEVVLHEIGHTFGLDHSPATDEIMYFQAGQGVYPDGQFRGLYGNGDLAGLAAGGLGQGCVHKIRGREGAFRSGVIPKTP